MASVPLERMLELANPLSDWPWCCEAPTNQEIARLLSSAPLEPEPVCTDDAAVRHIGRIRYLVQHGWDDAIEIDVGVPALGYPGPEWPVTDGNHRLAAAQVRGDKTIRVDVAGQTCHAARLLRMEEAILLDGRAEGNPAKDLSE